MCNFIYLSNIATLFIYKNFAIFIFLNRFISLKKQFFFCFLKIKYLNKLVQVFSLKKKTAQNSIFAKILNIKILNCFSVHNNIYHICKFFVFFKNEIELTKLNNKNNNKINFFLSF